MHLDGWTLLLQAINFLVLVWLLRHFLYRPVLAVIAERQAATERVRAEAEGARSDADRIRHGLETARAGLTEERDRLLADARTQAEAERAALLDKARAEADRLLADGRAKLEEERRQALDGLRGHAAALGTAVARRLLAMAADGTATRPFLDAACRSVESLPEPQRRALAAGGDGPVPVRLVGAGTPPAEEVGRCRDRLAAALGHPVMLTVAEDSGLIAGVELHFPHTVLRHSWQQALAEAKEELAADDDAAHNDHAHDDAQRRA